MATKQQEVWGFKVVGYLFLAGLGSGAFGAAAGLDLHTSGQTHYLTYVGAWIGLLGVGLGTLLLLWDLGVPWRFFRLVGNCTSMISIGTVVLSVMLALAALTIGVHLFSWSISATAYRILTVAAITFALGVSVYVGFLLAVVKCRPFWNTPMLPLLFVVSSLSTGTTTLGLAGSLGGAIYPSIAVAEIMALVETSLLTVELVMLAFYLAVMDNSLPPARTAVRRLMGGDLAGVFWVGVVLVGLLAPLLLMAGGISSPWLVAILVLAGGFSLRYSVLFAGARALSPGENPRAAFVH